MDTTHRYMVKLTRRDGIVFWAVDGPGATMLALKQEEAGEWLELNHVIPVAAWWRNYFDFDDVRVDVVRATITYVATPFGPHDAEEVGHG